MVWAGADMKTARKIFTHIDEHGRAGMVDVTRKANTQREAIAGCSIVMKAETLSMIAGGKVPKGDVLCVARIAGIGAAKRTGELIPLCHPLNLSAVDIDFSIDTAGNRLDIRAKVRTTGKTGVEMEALTAVVVAALTVYDMCKSFDREMVISAAMLLEKKGGKSGVFRRK
jgi:cyclic pyranopterin monophosphate synthase